MTTSSYRHLYGPVPSRRLGRSLGLDLVPFKICSYDCIYCQLGRTTRKTISRRQHVPVAPILAELETKLGEVDRLDTISLAGSGEPTLNTGIGELIDGIKNLTDIPVAVLTNGSLLWMTEVQDALMHADLVLPSIDAGDEQLFRQVNRPHTGVSFEKMISGIEAFSRRFPGEVWLEVFLLGGVTGLEEEVAKIADHVRRIKPARVQLNTVSRPPAEGFALAVPHEEMLVLKELLPGKVEIICETLRPRPRIAGRHDDTDGEIVALLSRRPCTCAEVAEGLGIHVNEAVKHLEALAADGAVRTVFIGRRNYFAATTQKAEA